MDESTEALKVDDLVSTTSLDVSVLAGEAGLQRAVLWAHSCEMSNPEQWLGPHELLMTVGLCVPKEASDQVAFIARLADASLAGLMIGDHDTVPPVSQAMLDEADCRSFPVLWAETHTPYAIVARHVAAANMDSQTLLVLKLSKFYHIAANSDDAGELVDGLATLLSVDIRVVDTDTGLTVISGAHPSKAQPHPEPRKYPLKGNYSTELQLSEYPGEALDGMLLVHLLKVLELSVGRVLSAADFKTNESSHILRSLLNGEQSRELSGHLSPYRASDGFQIAAFPTAYATHIARLTALHGLPVLVGPGRVGQLVLLPTEVVPQFLDLARPQKIQFGASSVFTDFHDAPVAANEAARVLVPAYRGEQTWTEFKGTMVSVLSRSRQEASEIISGVLGPLASNANSATKLRETLFTFLRNDRRWQETADELGIHRQTLSYRLNRIEEETGGAMTRTADISSFWVAYQAWESVHGQ